MKTARLILVFLSFITCVNVTAREEMILMPLVLHERHQNVSCLTPESADKDEGLPAVIVRGNVVKLPPGLQEEKSGVDGERNFSRPGVGKENPIYYTIKNVDLETAQYVTWPHGRMLKLNSLAHGEFDRDILLDSGSLEHKTLCVNYDTVWYNPEIIKNDAILFGGFGGENSEGKNIYTAAWRCEIRSKGRLLVLLVQKSTSNFCDLPTYRTKLKTIIEEWANDVLEDYPPDKDHLKDEMPKPEPQTEIKDEVAGESKVSEDDDPMKFIKWLFVLGIMFFSVYRWNKMKGKKQ